MTDHHHGSHGEPAGRGESGGSRWIVRLLMLALLAVGAYYVVTEHGAHLLAAWPLLILLLCPLMHLLHGHGGHSGHGRHDNTTESRNG